MNPHLRIPLLLAGLLLTVPAHAQGSAISEHRPLNADARVSVNNTAGLIEVESWDKNELSLTGKLGESVESLALDGGAANLKIEVKLIKKKHNIDETVLKLRVPVGTRLDLQGVSTDISVQGVRGALAVNSVSGTLILDIGSAELEAQTVSGDVRLRAPHATKARVQSVSGDIVLDGGQGELRGETVSGAVQVNGGSFDNLRVQSVSGDITLLLGAFERGTLAAETLSGNVNLELAGTPSADITLNTFSGDLHSGYGGVPAEAKRYEAKLGAGKGNITLSSFSGDISLSRR